MASMTVAEAIAADDAFGTGYSRQGEIGVLHCARRADALMEQRRAANALCDDPRYRDLMYARARQKAAENVQHPEPGVLTYGLTPPAGSVPLCGGAI